MTHEARTITEAMQALHPGHPLVVGQPIRILIADADPSFVTSLQRYLTSQRGFNVVAQVDTCGDAVIWCEELRPNILILDWHLMFDGLLPTEIKGIAFLDRIRSLPYPPGIIVASRLSLDDHRTAALAAGADEFMPKSKFPQLLGSIIKRLLPQF